MNFWVCFSVETKSPGVKRKTVIRLMQIPLARARPRSGPMPKRMTDSARKPIITVTALEKTAVPARLKAAFMSSAGLPYFPRHS